MGAMPPSWNAFSFPLDGPRRLRRHVIDDAVDACLLYTSDAADERSGVDLGGRRIIKKKNIIKKKKKTRQQVSRNTVNTTILIRYKAYKTRDARE